MPRGLIRRVGRTLRHRFDRTSAVVRCEYIDDQRRQPPLDLTRKRLAIGCFYTYVVEAYERLGYEMIELPRTSVEERTALIINHIEART